MRTTVAGRFLRACVSGDAWASPSEEVARLAQIVSADAVGIGAEFHGVSGYVTSALRATHTGSAILEAVQPAYYRGVFMHLQTLADLVIIDATLRAHEVPYVVIKGPVLATQTHPRADLRAYCDLDLVVAPPYFSRAVAALTEAGCVPVLTSWGMLRDVSAGEIAMVSPSGGALDLHWNTINAPTVRAAFAVDPAKLVARARTARIGDSDVPVLEDADNLVYVAMHSVLSGGHRLLWVKDVDQLVAGDPPWDAVIARAREVGGALVVAVALAQAQSLLGTCVPAGVGRALSGASIWPAASTLATRVSHPEAASKQRALLSRVVARSTRADVRSSVRELLRRARSAQQRPGLRPSDNPPDSNPVAAQAQYMAWVDEQVNGARL